MKAKHDAARRAAASSRATGPASTPGPAASSRAARRCRAAHPAGSAVAGVPADRDADVAAARVQAQRPALQPLRVEGVDVGHGRGEVAAARPGRSTTAAATAGTSSRALTQVQFRPPNRATARAYGSRRTAPTVVGSAVSRNFSAAAVLGSALIP